jgi:hypothetical protein
MGDLTKSPVDRVRSPNRKHQQHDSFQPAGAMNLFESLIAAECANEIGSCKGGAIPLLCRLSVKIVGVSCFSVDSRSRCATFAAGRGPRKSRIDQTIAASVERTIDTRVLGHRLLYGASGPKNRKPKAATDVRRKGLAISGGTKRKKDTIMNNQTAVESTNRPFQ